MYVTNTKYQVNNCPYGILRGDNVFLHQHIMQPINIQLTILIVDFSDPD